LPAQRFPWVGGGSWTARVAGDQVAPPAGRVATLFARGSPEPPQIPNHIEIPSYTQGSLTISPRPEAIRFTGDAQFEVAQRRTVPASGALGIEHRFTVGTTSAEVEAQAAEMEQRARAGLAIAITSATQVSGYDPSYVVSGVAVTSGGARSLLVNGQPVALRADGSWSASMQLAPGVNPLSATVTDHAGDGASANGSVTVDDPHRRGQEGCAERAPALPDAPGRELRGPAEADRARHAREAHQARTPQQHEDRDARDARVLDPERRGLGQAGQAWPHHAQDRAPLPHQARDADAHPDGRRRHEGHAHEHRGPALAPARDCSG
jgi:hypothetical protein